MLRPVTSASGRGAEVNDRKALLWPIHKRFCLDLFDSDGAVNRIVGRVCGAVAFCLGAVLAYIAVQPYMVWFVVPIGR